MQIHLPKKDIINFSNKCGKYDIDHPYSSNFSSVKFSCPSDYEDCNCSAVQFFRKVNQKEEIITLGTCDLNDVEGNGDTIFIDCYVF